jgi:mono/diheme cytochrome c family protein
LPEGIESSSDPRLIALGREAFGRYPVQLAPQWRVALTSRAAAAHYGLWVDDGRQSVGGIVRARMADGSGALMVTCATCHAARLDGAITDGVPNARLEAGAALLDAAGGPDVPAVAAWGPGRLDVTTPAGTEPARIPDLRPVRWLTYLQQAAAVRARDLAALAIRIETLIIVSHNGVTRPPRLVTLGLAAYLLALGDDLPPLEAAKAVSPRGATVFTARCARCHAGPGLTGEPVAIDYVGTDPTLGMSADRGTGKYRVPSLRGVGTRGPLLHDGTVPSLDAMFDPTRTTPAFAAKLHGAGAVSGHRFGLDLDPLDRAALVAFLKAL